MHIVGYVVANFKIAVATSSCRVPQYDTRGRCISARIATNSLNTNHRSKYHVLFRVDLQSSDTINIICNEVAIVMSPREIQFFPTSVFRRHLVHQDLY
jgi:hypothetical protein